MEKEEKIRINKLFLIGNGFDLAHGLATSYKDFIIWYLKDSCLKAKDTGVYEDDCITVKINIRYFSARSINIEDYINDIILKDEIWKFIYIKKGISAVSNLTRARRVETDYSIQIEPKSNFCTNLLGNCLKSDWSGIEAEINRTMLKEHLSLAEKRNEILVDRDGNILYQKARENIQNLNKSIYTLKAKLIEYLSLNNDPGVHKYQLLRNNANNDWGEEIPQFDHHKPIDIYGRNVLFLNFNYTTYFRDKIMAKFNFQFRDAYTTSETLYIHGSLDEDIENIVFGVGDENKEIYADLETLYHDDWLEPLKSFHYFRNEKYTKLLGFIESGNYEIYVIGHSCSITDRTLLNMLFENEYCQKIHVYHYKGIKSYLETAYNIARNFNDKVRLRKVLQPFNPDLSTK